MTKTIIVKTKFAPKFYVVNNSEIVLGPFDTFKKARKARAKAIKTDFDIARRLWLKTPVE